MDALFKLLGLDSDWNSGYDTSARLSEGWPAWLLILLLIAVVVYYVWQYRRDAWRLSTGRKITITLLRVAVVALLLLMLTRPVLNLTHTEKRTPLVAVLVDESLSMGYPDGRHHPLAKPEDPSRYQIAKQAAAQLLGPMKLNRKHRVTLYKFAGTLQQVHEWHEGSGSSDKLDIHARLGQPSGVHSNPGDALMDVARQLEANKVSSLILISDGRSTATSLSGATTLDEAGQYLKKKGIPVHTIVTGTADPLRDLALPDLIAPREANVNDVLSMRITVINHIEPGLQTTLTLLEDGKPKVIRKIRLSPGRNDVVMSTHVEGPKLGERKYTIQAPKFADELSYDNNEISAHVNIVKRTLRCLLIAGKPTVEYHYIWPALVRDPIINVSCWLQDADVNYVQQGNDPIERLPRTPKEWDKYDVCILYDIDPEKFTNEQETGLEQLIRTGAGLFFIAGRSHGLDSLLTVRTAKMGAMLPVEIDRNKHPDYHKVLDKPFKPVRTKAGRRHPLFLFDMNPEANDRVWESFPEFFWAHPTISVKPRAISLLEKEKASADGKVLMALWRYGEGAVVYSGVDSIWRWRYPFENYDYDRCYSQIVRYLGETRLLGSQKQVVLGTDEKLYSPGGKVEVALHVLDPALLAQLQRENLRATVTDPQGGVFQVALTSPGPKSQFFIGQYRPKRIGEYKVQANHTLADASSAQKKVFDETAHFHVRLQSLEEVDKTADVEAMVRLAKTTGGKAYDHVTAKNLGDLPGSISAEPQLIPHRTEEDIWDSPLFLALFVGLIGCEWVLRKKWSLL